MLENHGATASDHSIWLATVARYASPEAAPRIREIFEQREPACQEALVGYFVRADPDYAASILGGNWNMRSVPPPCHFQYLQNAANYGMGPVLEKFLTAYLFHSHVPLKQAAAMSLQRHGSPAAQEALFAAMRHFHNYWKGREDELQQNSEGTSFQHVLVHSLTGASHWTLPAQRIQALRDLCIGAQCQQHTGHLIQTWQQPLNVNAIQSQGGFRGTLAQYSFNSREQMRTRIRQLPAGTHIRVSVAGADAEALRAVILGEAATAGLVVD
nr:hypothetical protein [Bryobacterales bacterium]